MKCQGLSPPAFCTHYLFEKKTRRWLAAADSHGRHRVQRAADGSVLKKHLLCTSQFQQAPAENACPPSQRPGVLAAPGEGSGLALDSGKELQDRGGGVRVDKESPHPRLRPEIAAPVSVPTPARAGTAGEAHSRPSVSDKTPNSSLQQRQCDRCVLLQRPMIPTANPGSTEQPALPGTPLVCPVSPLLG